MKINEKIIEILAKISEKRKTQDTYGTRNPIYLVQRRKTRTVDPEYGTVEEKDFIFLKYLLRAFVLRSKM